MKSKVVLFFAMAVVVGETSPAWPERIFWGPDPVPLPAKASSVCIADLDRNGRLDVAAALEETGKVAVLLSREGILDGPLTEYPAGLGPIEVKGADLDASGAEDLVVVNAGSGSIHIFLNRGDGTFGQGAEVQVGPTPRAASMADFDGDRVPDIAVVGQVGEIMVLFNTGSGAFHDATTLPIGGGAHNFAAADFDGDALPDLAVGFEENRDGKVSGAVSFFRSLGGRRFAPAVHTTIGSGDDFIPRFLAPGDFNRDGRDDVALVAKRTTGRLDLFTFELGEAGAFRVRFAGSVPGVPSGMSYFLVAEGIDGDAILDIATPLETLGDCGLRIYRGLEGGNFDILGDFLLGTAARAMAFADLDGNGSADACLAPEGEPQLEVCRAQAPGQLKTRTVIPIDGPPRALAAADVELDGKTEIVVMSASALDIVRRREEGGFAPPSVVQVDAAGLQDLAAADFDGSGRIQIALADLGNGRVLVGSFSASGFAVAAEHKVGDFPLQLAAADLDGDRICDLAVADMGSPSVTLLFKPGGTTAPDGGARRAELTVGAPQKAIAAADLNADEIPDLAVATRTGIVVFAGAGGGSFERKREIETAEVMSFIVVGDLGGDGVTDLAAGRGKSIVIFSDPASGATPEPIQVSLPSEVLALALTDADGDGLSDVVAAVQRGILVFRSLGGIQLATPQAYRVGESPRALLLADLDGDETIDCASADFASKAISILHGRGRRRAPGFLRGDADSSGRVTITDAVRVCGRLFLGGLPFKCDDSADANDDGRIDLTDAVCILQHLFLGGESPPEPGPLDCGDDPTQDSLEACRAICPSSPAPPRGAARR